MTVVSEHDFRTELEMLINRHNREAYSNTSDFILAQFLHSSLFAFDTAVNAREAWYNKPPPHMIVCTYCGKPLEDHEPSQNNLPLTRETSMAMFILRVQSIFYLDKDQRRVTFRIVAGSITETTFEVVIPAYVIVEWKVGQEFTVNLK